MIAHLVGEMLALTAFVVTLLFFGNKLFSNEVATPNPKLWFVTWGANSPEQLDKHLPATQIRISDWEPFGATTVWVGQGYQVPMAETMPGSWATMILWRCNVRNNGDVG